ncbi:MAG: sodium-translocating pyrophosphatase [Candidatus Krumholzibacteria bacterium]|nr:sodium-translocating pyrophosphatase [Candidatus Krumholzibacteria bacterium]
MATTLLQVIPWIGALGMLVAVITFFAVKRHSPGNETMQQIADRVYVGAMTFLKREYTIITIFMVVIFVALAWLLGIWTGVAYLAGAMASMFAGWFGMQAATRSAARACQGAKEGGTPAALSIAFQGGSVMGLSVASLGVLGLGIFFLFLRHDPQNAPLVINGFAMGASSIALFARVGGGIYTKSADVGADLVGKVEAGIPEDDPRNPGVIADNVGDNVGDTAGMGADLFESYVGSVVATMAIGATFAEPLARMTLPLALIASGLIASLVGIFSMGFLKKLNPQSALRFATYISGGVFVIFAYFLTSSLLGDSRAFWAIVAGLVGGLLIAAESEYYTSGPPIRAIAEAAESGPATTIITGLAIGFKSTILPMITICAAIFVAYQVNGLYGIALAGVGMLSTIGLVMSTDSYGPIADNAGGVAEMSKAGPEIRKITDQLDALGNTTAAIGKGFAIGSAAITALALFSAYQTTVGIEAIDLTRSNTVIGLFLGAMMPFVIAALTMEAVGRAANKMVMEIRRQFREIKGLLEGNAEPDVQTCIDIVTKGALREMVAPGLIALASPLLIGFIMGPESLGGFLAGATATGVLLGVFMANSGGAWDNGKKYIEDGHHGGKGSDAHKAAVVGDTVGDPFKDTSGPSMNILIKLMAVVSLVFAPVIAKMM